jgi:hypothetical protein
MKCLQVRLRSNSKSLTKAQSSLYCTAAILRRSDLALFESSDAMESGYRIGFGYSDAHAFLTAEEAGLLQHITAPYQLSQNGKIVHLAYKGGDQHRLWVTAQPLAGHVMKSYIRSFDHVRICPLQLHNAFIRAARRLYT